MKHRRTRLLLALSFLALLTPFLSFAETFEVDGINYRLGYYYAEGAWVVAKDNNEKYSGEIVIPETVTYEDVTYTVTQIEYGAFKDCSELTSITIPSTVVRIGFYEDYDLGSNNPAFSGCTSLSEVIFEDGEKPLEVAYSSFTVEFFYGGTSLDGPNVSYSCSTRGLFSDCPVETVYIGRHLEYELEYQGTYPSYWPLGYGRISELIHPFKDNKSLTSVVISSAVTNIGWKAFTGCTSLKSVELSNSVTTIGRYAFTGCTGLTSIELPNSVTEIDQYAFSDCPNLTSIEIPNSVTKIDQGVFSGCTGLTSIKIPNSVTSLGGFPNCTGLKSIEIPNSVTIIIGFSGCTGLTSIEIPNSVTTLNGFSGCTGLTSIKIPNSVTSLGGFSNCTGLQSIEIPNSVTNIDQNAFSGCTGLKSIYIHNSTIEIGKKAFYCCTSLKTISIPYNLNGTSLSRLASVLGKDFPVTVRLPESDTEKIFDDNWDFYYFNNITINQNSTNYVFVNIPESLSVTNVLVRDEENNVSVVNCDEVQRVICNDKNIKTIHNGQDISELTNSADGYKYQLTTNRFSPENTFYTYGAEDLNAALVLPTAGSLFNKLGVENIEKTEVLKISGDINGTDIMTINRMVGLKWLDLSEANIVEGGATYRENLKTANDVVGSDFFYNISLDCLVLPKSAVKIADNACRGQSSLKVLAIGPNVESIGSGAFMGCNNLLSVVMPAGVKEIGASAFENCEVLAEAKIPDAVETIGESAFRNTAISEVRLPAGVTEIGATAFADCPNITDVYSLNPIPPKTDTTTFDSETEQRANLHVSEDALALYWLDPVWKEFSSIRDDLFGIEAIPEIDSADADSGEVTVYDLAGTLIYRGPRSETRLNKGFYIITQGQNATKIYIK